MLRMWRGPIISPEFLAFIISYLGDWNAGYLALHMRHPDISPRLTCNISALSATANLGRQTTFKMTYSFSNYSTMFQSFRDFKGAPSKVGICVTSANLLRP